MKTKTITFQIPGNKVKGAAIFAGRKDIRYYLNGCQFSAQADGVVIVATDGHRLTAIYHAQAEKLAAFAVVVPIEDLERAVKAHGRSKLDLVVHVMPKEGEEPRTIRILADGGAVVIECKEIDGRFPDWQRVMPPDSAFTQEEIALAGFNADYLGDYAKLHRALGNRYTGVRITPRGDSSAIVDIGNPEVVCILMPMRVDAPSAMPEWTKAPAPAQEAEKIAA